MFEINKVLVVAPLRVASTTWPNEIKKWDHLKNIKYSVVVGNENQRMDALNKKAHVYLINRENITWLIDNSGINFDFDMVVIDELSSFKSYKSKRFKSLRKVRPNIKRIVGLTGTPTSNSLMDLWAEIGLLDMGERLGRFIGRYRETYFLPDKRNQHIIFSYKPKENAEEEIYRKIADITISMKSLDYLKMPECVINDVFVEMDDSEIKLYKKLKKEMILPFENGDIDASNAAGLSNKLMQIASGAVYDENSESKIIHNKKLDLLEDLVEASNGKPVLIAYWFKHDLTRIQQRFNAIKLESSDDILRWNAGLVPVAVIHPASCGHGLNLQNGGSTLVWFSLPWSLELYEQTNARLYRQGQTETVVIHRIITKSTIDEDIAKALKSKEVSQDRLIEAVKARIK